MKVFIFFFLLSLSFSSFAGKTPYTLVLSVDGFRHDYPDLFDLKFMKKMRSLSQSKKSLSPVYPSKTFPNHISMVTGLYPDEHGIVGNIFYSKQRKKMYSIKDKASKTDPLWYQAEPFWATLEKRGILTASYYWPTSEVYFNGVRPSYVRIWDEDFDVSDADKGKLDQVYEWLSLPEEKRPHLVFAYLAKIDQVGHHHTPESEELQKALKELDSYLESFYERLKSLPLSLNLIICSDHGMTTLTKKNLFFLEDLVSLEEGIKVVGKGSLVHLYFEKEEAKQKSYKVLKEKSGEKFTAYLREETPEHYHLGKSKNSGDLVLVVNYPHYLMEKRTPTREAGGDHGYDPRVLKDMHGIYYASGEDLKKSSVKVRETKDIHAVLKSLYKFSSSSSSSFK